MNFVVPSLPTLRKEFDSSDPGCENSGLIFKHSDAYAQQTENGKSYKICFDGKKICQGFGTKLGEVDLFGYESKPTLKEKQRKLVGLCCLMTSGLSKDIRCHVSPYFLYTSANQQIRHQATHKVGCQPGDFAYGHFNIPPGFVSVYMS